MLRMRKNMSIEEVGGKVKARAIFKAMNHLNRIMDIAIKYGWKEDRFGNSAAGGLTPFDELKQAWTTLYELTQGKTPEGCSDEEIQEIESANAEIKERIHKELRSQNRVVKDDE